ncbi:nucleotide kinase [Staphylococcus phage phiRS7]|uniref:nucleotide kinase n=1 Tax=Staphylococcus phage phiRS7 TaxID=1403390 RepID=UPI0003B08E65|nr:nucleotide kinase [Staphylococcus phage phiRS7]AGW43785.1 hypothetical protein phiRS7_0049 [Staphylococcus phage phiRS7]
MKIRDLDLDQYVIVYDIGKSEHSEGMTVVGRVEEIVFNDDNDNVATINSLGNLYDITDDNDFELWSKSIEGKTESVSKVGLRNLNVGDWIQYVENNGQERFGKVSSLTGLQAEKSVDNDTRIELELLNGKTDSIKQNSSEWIKVRPNEAHLLEKDYRERFVQSNDLQQRKRNDTVNHPSHYNYGDIEVINFIEQVTKHYNPNVAYHIGNAIKYLARSPHKNGKEDIDKARWYIERAFENWDK